MMGEFLFLHKTLTNFRKQKNLDTREENVYNNLRIILKFERGGVCGTLSDRTKEKTDRVHDQTQRKVVFGGGTLC